MKDKNPTACADCQRNFGCFSSGAACAKCGTLICKTCANTHVLIPFDDQNPRESNNVKINNKLQSFCKSCFQDSSVLDFSKTFDVLEPTPSTDSTSTSMTNLLFVHGGGGSRAMFRPHARVMAEKYGYRCILMDLPGHGTLVETPLSPDSSADAVFNVLSENNLKPEDKIIYIGGSLGAYLGFHILQIHQQYFQGAILLDCGQNVGPGASMKARLGLYFLKAISSNMSNKALTGMMQNVVASSPADYHLVESVYGAGFTFQQGGQQVECLKSVAPATILPNLKIPFLFMNGSKDYRDSEDRWLSLCQDKTRSELKVYDGGDHFFTHDQRFIDDMLERFHAFIQQSTS